MLPDKQAAIVAVCDTGQRSALAAATLRELGYQRVSVLKGGLHGRPLVQGLDGANVPAKWRRVTSGTRSGPVRWPKPWAK